MARITAGATMSHVPVIGRAVDTDQTETDYWKPAFAGFEFSKKWIKDNLQFDKDTQVSVFEMNIRFIGGLRLTAPHLTVAAPEWSRAPHMLSARDVKLDLRYTDVWRAHRGGAAAVRRERV